MKMMSSLLVVAQTGPASEDGVHLGGVKSLCVLTVRTARQPAVILRNIRGIRDTATEKTGEEALLAVRAVEGNSVRIAPSGEGASPAAPSRVDASRHV